MLASAAGSACSLSAIETVCQSVCLLQIKPQAALVNSRCYCSTNFPRSGHDHYRCKIDVHCGAMTVRSPYRRPLALAAAAAASAAAAAASAIARNSVAVDDARSC